MIDEGAQWIVTPPMFVSILEVCADFGIFSPFHVVWDVNIVISTTAISSSKSYHIQRICLRIVYLVEIEDFLLKV